MLLKPLLCYVLSLSKRHRGECPYCRTPPITGEELRKRLEQLNERRSIVRVGAEKRDDEKCNGNQTKAS